MYFSLCRTSLLCWTPIVGWCQQNVGCCCSQSQILSTATDKIFFKNPLHKELQSPAALKQLQEIVRRLVKCWRKSSKSRSGFVLDWLAESRSVSKQEYKLLYTVEQVILNKRNQQKETRQEEASGWSHSDVAAGDGKRRVLKTKSSQQQVEDPGRRLDFHFTTFLHQQAVERERDVTGR